MVWFGVFGSGFACLCLFYGVCVWVLVFDCVVLVVIVSVFAFVGL